VVYNLGEFDAFNTKPTIFSPFCLTRKVGVRIPGRVKSKTEQLAPAASLVSVHQLRPRTSVVGPGQLSYWVVVSCLSAAWYFGLKIRFEPGPVPLCHE